MVCPRGVSVELRLTWVRCVPVTTIAKGIEICGMDHPPLHSLPSRKGAEKRSPLAGDGGERGNFKTTNNAQFSMQFTIAM